MQFNSARRVNFPDSGFVGDLWYCTDTQMLYIATSPSGAFWQAQTDSDYQAHPRLYAYGLTVKQGLKANLPSSAAVGEIFLTTDTLEAFAATGPGTEIVKFHLNVRRALAAGDPSRTF